MSQPLVVFKPFIEASETLSATSALLSQVIPIARHLHKWMGAFVDAGDPVTGHCFIQVVRDMAQRLREGLGHRMDAIQQERPYMLATMCDPCL